MKTPIFCVVAGIPPEAIGSFGLKFREGSIISIKALKRSLSYTSTYSTALYEKAVEYLRSNEPLERSNLLAQKNLVLIYLDRSDGSEEALVDAFGVEALVVPLRLANFSTRVLATKNQRDQFANDLVGKGVKAVRYAHKLLSVIREEVTNNDNRTCLLLPPNNFGREFDEIWDCIRSAELERLRIGEFRQRIRYVVQSLRSVRQGTRTFFEGQGKVVFKSPRGIGARHGLSPTWEDDGHDASCVIRGRLRFGVSYDPKFHYDCNLRSSGTRNYPSCHGTKQIEAGKSHVNIAPNDNVR